MFRPSGAIRPGERSAELAIIGAGIGGLAVAVALRAQRIPCTIYERAPELRPVGAGLLLSPNGITALDFLGVRNEAERHSRIIREWRILNKKGGCLQRLRPIQDGLPAFSLHRADLQAILVGRLTPPTLRLGCELTTYWTDEAAIHLEFAAGTTATAGALIGADGLRSAVRATRFGKESLRYAGYLGWRGVSTWTPPEYSSDFLSESWAEGKRFGISPMGHGRCYWYATANLPETAAAAPQARETLLALFHPWHRPICDLIESTPETAILTTAIFDRPPKHRWTAGPVTLLGDAAHPMTPNLGQGACCALEDACVLARSIERCTDFAEAFQRFEQVRSKRTDYVQRASWCMGNVIQLENPISTLAREACLRLTPNRIADWSMRRLFRFSP